MNALNRIVMVVLLLFAIVLCSLLLVGSRQVLPAVAWQSSALAESIEGLEWYQLELPGGALACVVNLVLVFFIFLQVRRPSQKAIRVEKAGGGEVLVSVASIADRIKHEVGQISDVLRTRPKVSGKRKGVVVELDVEAGAGVSVPEKAEQIVEVVRRAVEEDMGLELARPPKVNLRVAPYSKARKSPVRPGKVPPAQPKEAPPVEPEDWSVVEPIEAVEVGEGLPDLPEGWED